MSADSSQREPLDLLIDDYLVRYRRGERPSPSEYAARYPDLADDICDLFPALAMMEQAGSASARGLVDASAREPVLPERIGEFRIIRLVGRGGMGFVYEAEQESLGRRVALKVLPLHALMAPKQMLRFQREARAAAALHHSHIVPVFSVGQCDGACYYAMQFIEGQSLDHVILQLGETRRLEIIGEKLRHQSVAFTATTERRVAHPQEQRSSGEPTEFESEQLDATVSAHLDDTRRALVDRSASRFSSQTSEYYRSVADMGLQAAEGLAYAHAEGVIHRDIKPSNLILDHDGKVWVTDFGLAKISDEHSMTQTGDVLGTFRYMAPEQLQGWADPRTDIHGLGLVLFELFALRPAFAGPDRGRLLQQVTDTVPPPLRRFDSRIPRDLETIVAKATAKDPGDRYLSAAELAADLRRFLADQPVKARRTSSAELLRRWCRRNRLIASLVATVFILLLAFASATTAMNWRLNASLAATRQAERDKTDLLWQSRLNEVLALQQTRRPGQSTESWEKLREAVTLAREVNAGEDARRRLRNAAISTLARTDLQFRLTGPEEAEGASILGFDPPLDRYLCSDGHGNVSVRRVDDGREVGSLPSKGFSNDNLLAAVWPRFSADGRWLALSYVGKNNPQGVDEVGIWDVEQGQVALVVPAKSRLTGVDLSRDGTRLAICGSDRIVQVVDVPEGNMVARFRLPFAATEFRFSPRGDRLAAGSYVSGADVHVVDVPTGLVLHQFPHERAASLAWHPAGTMLAVASNDFQIHIWNLTVGREQTALRGHQALPNTLMFSPDGRLLISSTYDGTVRLWNPWTGEELVRAACSKDSVLSDDGLRAMIRQGAKYVLCDVHRSEAYSSFPVGPISASGRFQATPGIPHPHRDWLPMGGHEGVRLLDLHTGEQLASVAIGHTENPVWSPDGRAMYTVSPNDLRRWKLTETDGSTVLGPPETLGPRGINVQVHPQGTQLAVGNISGNPYHIDLTQPVPSPPQKIDHISGMVPAYSPDGRWFAIGTHHGRGLRVWRIGEVPSVKLLLPDSRRVHPKFSPDSRWLAASENGFVQLWSVGDWRLIRSVETKGGFFPSFAFSPDAHILAVGRSPHEIILQELASGRELAVLDAVEEIGIGDVRFTGDGSSVIVASAYPPIVHIWRLDVVRRRLNELGLADDLPIWPTPTQFMTNSLPTPKRIVFDEGLSISALFQRSEDFRGRRMYEPACADLELVLKKDPNYVPALSRLAWLRAFGPSTVRDASQAELLARRANELQPNYSSNLRILAAALIRGNRFDEALEALAQAKQYASQPSHVPPRTGELYYLVLVAIAQAHRGEMAAGRDALGASQKNLKEVRSELSPMLTFEVESLQSEAALLLDAT